MRQSLLNIAEHCKDAVEARVAIHAESDQFVLLLTRHSPLLLETTFARRNVRQQQPQACNGNVDLLEGWSRRRRLVLSSWHMPSIPLEGKQLKARLRLRILDPRYAPRRI